MNGPAHVTQTDFLAPDDPVLTASPLTKRDNLPPPLEKLVKPSTWEFMAKLAKEGGMVNYLYTGVFPIVMHEPQTELQRKAESIANANLLDKAVREPKGSENRLLLVTAFNIASWVEACDRLGFKAIRPLDNETYELVDPVKGYKLLMEDVYHNKETNQYTTTWKIWGRGWGVEAQTEPRLKFTLLTGPCIEFNANFRGEVLFQDGDRYTIMTPPGQISTLASSKSTYSYKGAATVTNVGTGLACETDLSEPRILSSGSKRRVKGHILRNGRKVEGVKLSGSWDSKIVASWTGKKDQILWQKSTQPHPENMYNLSSFAVQLNNLSPELLAVLPPTDSRLRADLQLLENGVYSKAQIEQDRLVARNCASRGPGQAQARPANWFEPREEDSASELKFRYKGGYWEARAAKALGNTSAWAACPDIFDLGVDPAKAIAKLAI